MYDYRRGGSALGAFVLGGLVGAVLGLLFAPRPGKESRDMLAEAAEKYWDEGRDLYETGSAKVTEVYTSGRESATQTAEELKSKIDEARGRLKEQVEKASEVAKDKVSETVPVAREAVGKAGEAVKAGVETAEKKAQDTLDFVAQKASKGSAGVTVPGEDPIPEV